MNFNDTLKCINECPWHKGVIVSGTIFKCPGRIDDITFGQLEEDDYDLLSKEN